MLRLSTKAVGGADPPTATGDHTVTGGGPQPEPRRAERRGKPPGDGGVARPSYRVTAAQGQQQQNNAPDGGEGSDRGGGGGDDSSYSDDSVELENVQANITTSAGALRLNRILRSTDADAKANAKLHNKNSSNSDGLFGSPAFEKHAIEKVSDPRNIAEVELFSGRVVVPPIKVDPNSIGGSMLDGYPDSMLQECLLASHCHVFESTGAETVALSALQYPNDYSKHKRGLGLFGGTGGGGGNKRAAKIRYVLVARSTNRPLLRVDRERQVARLQRQKLQQQQQQQLAPPDGSGGPQQQSTTHNKTSNEDDEPSAHGDDYDAMFAPDDDASKDLSMHSDKIHHERRDSLLAEVEEKKAQQTQQQPQEPNVSDVVTTVQKQLENEEEISSFPVLLCMTLHSDGSGPDIRKLIPLDQLATVQDLHSTVVQLAFRNGDTIRLEFGSGADGDDDAKNKVVERPLDKERFIWSLLQIHAMLCMSVVERNSAGTTFLPPLSVRNIDRAELQYVATVNGFLQKSEMIKTLLERQRKLVEGDQKSNDPDQQQQLSQKTKSSEKVELSDMDAMAYDLMMGNFATRVTLFHSEEERKDAEEILNSTEWTDMLSSKEETAAVSVAERLGYMLQSRMRDLEAETCRRLIAWEDEKHLSLGGRAKLHDVSDARDTVDALALASLFKTLESLDGELKSMEEWLQDRAAAIKPLTDDCADIEEENRQLEQQWKSYDMLGAEMRRLLESHEIDVETEKLLKNPASALVYDEEGLVDIEESEDSIDQVYAAGKALLEAMEFVSVCPASCLSHCVCTDTDICLTITRITHY